MFAQGLSLQRAANGMQNVMSASTAPQMRVAVGMALVSTNKKREITARQIYLVSIGACAITRTKRITKAYVSLGSL